MRVDKQYMTKFLTEVQEGAKVTVVEPNEDGFWMIAVPNPGYREDVGNDQYLVLKVAKE